MVLNWPHVHLMLNHIPVLGAVFGLALLVAGMYSGKEEVKKTALSTLFLTGIFAAATYLTGEPAEESVEGLSGVAKNLIEQHEEFAFGSMIAAVMLGLLSAGVLLRNWRGQVKGRLLLLVLLGAVAVSGAMTWTANLGGMIHHEELRPGYVDAGRNGDDD